MLTSPTATSGTCATPADDATTYSYDDKGNRTSSVGEDEQRRTNTYDQANRLTEVVDDNAGTNDPTSDMSRYDLNLWIGHPLGSATYLPR